MTKKRKTENDKIIERLAKRAETKKMRAYGLKCVEAYKAGQEQALKEIDKATSPLAKRKEAKKK